MPVGPADVRHDAPSLRARVRLRPDDAQRPREERSRSSATTAPTRGPTATPRPSTAPSGSSPCRCRGRRPVTYKFHITYDNGAADAYLPDPSNPTQVDDGFGGKNSVFSRHHLRHLDLRVDADRVRRHAAGGRRRSTGATPSSTGPSSIASSTATPPTTRPSAIPSSPAPPPTGRAATGRAASKITDGYFAVARRQHAVDHRARRQRRVGRPGHRRRHLLVHRLPRLLAARSRPRPSRASARRRS